MLTRRGLLRASASLASIGALASAGCAGAGARSRAPAGPQQILILGGTGFLGPHFVRDALARGHSVTLFNRGKTNPELFPELEQLRGDRRAGELEALRGREFDAVVDTSGYVPDHVSAVIEALGRCDHYLFVSSVSVYRDQHRQGLEVGDPLAPHPEPGNHDVARFYGPLKAECEAAAAAALPGRTTVIRPGLIVGPGDPTDRFSYWPARLARGGQVLAPGNPDDPVQLIDARDLAAFMVRCVEQRLDHTYNAAGPAQTLTIEGLVRGGLAAVATPETIADTTLTWVPAEFLAAHAVSPWMDMPVWVPPDSEFAGLGAVDNHGAIADGLEFRPLAQTMVDTLAWWNEQPPERRAEPRAGLPADREAEVLAAWKAKPGTSAS